MSGHLPSFIDFIPILIQIHPVAVWHVQSSIRIKSLSSCLTEHIRYSTASGLRYLACGVAPRMQIAAFLSDLKSLSICVSGCPPRKYPARELTLCLTVTRSCARTGETYSARRSRNNRRQHSARGATGWRIIIVRNAHTT